MDTFWNSTSQQCSKCSVGSYWNGNDCIQCKSTEYWNKTANSCQACAAGQTFNASSNSCVQIQCAGGKVYNLTSSSCQCPLSAPYWNGASCFTCPDNAFYNETANQCFACPQGYYAVRSAKKCIQCPTNTIFNTTT